VGIKADVTPRLRLNAAAYHYDYKDLQIQAVVIVGSSSVGTLTNAASAKIKGFEAGGEFVVTDNLKVRGGVDVLDAKFGSFPNATVNEQRPLVNGGGVGNVTVTRDVTGKRLIRAPKYTVNVGADYDRDFAGGTILASVSYFLSAKYFIEPLNRVAQPRYNVLNASLAWRSANNITFSVAGKNLTGAEYGVQTPVNANGDMVTYERGRQVIAGVSYGF
jgi:iron complex outermembrane recepter protein